MTLEEYALCITIYIAIGMAICIVVAIVWWVDEDEITLLDVVKKIPFWLLLIVGWSIGLSLLLLCMGGDKLEKYLSTLKIKKAKPITSGEQ